MHIVLPQPITTRLWGNCCAGCNAALESAAALAAAVDECGGDASAAAALYSQRRLPDVHALADLEQMAAVVNNIRRPIGVKLQFAVVR